MTFTCADSISTNTLAFSQATGNFAANCAGISRNQAHLKIGELPVDVEWVFARDRALTVRDRDGRWLSGCSLPRRAAMEMMRKLDTGGPVACFLAPTHAAQVRVALDQLRLEQAIIAIIPNALDLPLFLACEFFADDITKHRLWFAVGEDWAGELKRIFDSTPGLCAPTQFIRLPVVEDSVVDMLIPRAQKVFGEVNSERSSAIRKLRDLPAEAAAPMSLLCVATARNFRLWDDAGALLADLFDPSDAIAIDLDNPAQASALAVAQAASRSRAIVTANTSRGDLPGILRESIPWITWASGDRTPSFKAAGPLDRLITAYPQLAQKAGWPAERVHHAVFPGVRASTGMFNSSNSPLALIVDTRPIDVPDDLSDYSSHRVLWELIASDLRDEPFVLSEDIDEFLSRRMRKLNIAADNLPKTRFVHELMLPAYQQSLARLLIQAKLPMRLFGKNWDRIPEFAACAGGEIKTRENLREIAIAHAALVHVWPITGPHAIDALGRPVLRRRGSHGTSFLADARAMLAGRPIPAPQSASPLSRELIESILR